MHAIIPGMANNGLVDNEEQRIATEGHVLSKWPLSLRQLLYEWAGPIFLGRSVLQVGTELGLELANILASGPARLTCLVPEGNLAELVRSWPANQEVMIEEGTLRRESLSDGDTDVVLVTESAILASDMANPSTLDDFCAGLAKRLSDKGIALICLPKDSARLPLVHGSNRLPTPDHPTENTSRVLQPSEWVVRLSQFCKWISTWELRSTIETSMTPSAFFEGEATENSVPSSAFEALTNSRGQSVSPPLLSQNTNNAQMPAANVAQGEMASTSASAFPETPLSLETLSPLDSWWLVIGGKSDRCELPSPARRTIFSPSPRDPALLEQVTVLTRELGLKAYQAQQAETARKALQEALLVSEQELAKLLERVNTRESELLQELLESWSGRLSAPIRRASVQASFEINRVLVPKVKKKVLQLLQRVGQEI